MGSLCSSSDDAKLRHKFVKPTESTSFADMDNLSLLVTTPLLTDNELHSGKDFATILLNEYQLYGNILAAFGLGGLQPMFNDISPNIHTMIHLYQHFMIHLKQNYRAYICSNTKLDPSIQFVWRIHLLHPLQYITDCMKHFGQILCPPNELISDFGKDAEYNYYNIPSEHNENNVKLFTAMDLEKSVKVQFNFIYDIYSDERVWIEYIKPDKRRNFYILKYKQFLVACGWLLPKTISPTRMMDFVWHTHMAHFANYYVECAGFTRGKVLGHNNMTDQNAMDEHFYFIDEGDVIQDLKDNDCVSWDFRLYQEAIRRETLVFMNGYSKYCAKEFGIIIPSELVDVLCMFYFVLPAEDKWPDMSGPSYCSVTEFFHRIE